MRPPRLAPEAQERFLREQHVLAHRHPTHLVPIHTAAQHGDRQYFAMATIDGAPLHHVVGATYAQETAGRRGRTPTLAELAHELAAGPARNGKQVVRDHHPLTLSPAHFQSVARFMADAAEAVQHAHDVLVLHRDLKPSNMMVDTNGQCWLIDFGLAR